VARVSGKTDADAALEKIGNAVRELRKEQSVSQEALADSASLDRSHLGRIERGERNVTLLNLVKIAAALRVSVAELVNRAGI
jgi:transcriptional regulator with XRE-family HTH domain